MAIGLVGVGMERFFLRRLRGQVLGQVLMTIGFALIFQDLALLIWGGDPYTVPIPALLTGTTRLGGAVFPIYRIFIVGVAIVVGAGPLAGARPHAGGRDDPRRGGRRGDGAGRRHQRAARVAGRLRARARRWPRWAA